VGRATGAATVRRHGRRLRWAGLVFGRGLTWPLSGRFAALRCAARPLNGRELAREVRRPGSRRSRPPNFSLEPTPLTACAAAATPGPGAAQAQAPGGLGCGTARAH
jgi:hypothetical protein